jgi:hypothetical protein
MIRKLLYVVLLLCLISVLVSCANEDPILELKYETSYDNTLDRTYIKWVGYIHNRTILNIKEVTFKFELYNQGNFIRTTDEYTLNDTIGIGQSYLPPISGYANGNVDEIRLIYWYPEYETFYDTYIWWIIGCAVGCVLIALVVSIFIFINDYTVDDLFDKVKEFWYLIPSIPSVSALMGFLLQLQPYWVIGVFISGGLILSGLLIFFILGIKAFFDYL